MNSYYADLHIHIGRTEAGQPIKISASPQMTFQRILEEASFRKGLDLIGIIDAQSPPVQKEIREGIVLGKYIEHAEGGLRYGKTTCFLGAEIELKEPGGGPFHVLAYFPTLRDIEQFSKWLRLHMKNIQLSTQRLYQPIHALQKQVAQWNGFLIPAHVFTPFKSVYGSAAHRISHVFDMQWISAIELGLSSDRFLADQLSELQSLTFLSNSDAHSLSKIGREYNQIRMNNATFAELRMALHRENGRCVLANFGFDPRLGKYYHTKCRSCQRLWAEETVQVCPDCGDKRPVQGVFNRIQSIRDQPSQSPAHRPPYIHQVPLEMIPGVGKKTLERLLSHFQTEMNILHHVPLAQLRSVTTSAITEAIRLAREGGLSISEGGGGTYGKLKI